ncbi:hypothetical protein Ddye_030144 [Dipteronia dyeriana]|uniref:FAS1 domain-containing protein n=1 Tax=Dipteronia dyeriana TaxID=168575 RepID=A0AAD9TGG2_9ROSI|nr:hypothetical protein Ddye_030144 [Dipteronia dyeriana]
MAFKLLLSLVFLSLLSLSTPLPNNSIPNAVEILSNSSYVSMALTLEFASQTLFPQLQSLTIFSPSDSAFASSGQPSLSLLRFHFSPLPFSSQTLKSIPFNSKIPTLSANRSLIVTSVPFDHHVSLNGVKINGTAIYDDGSLRIFGIERFFDLGFRINEYDGNHSHNIRCVPMVKDGTMSFDRASRVLISKGYSVMASFLGLQLGVIKEQTLLTVFASVDQVMKVRNFGDFKEYSSIFLGHVVPCRISWTDLLASDNGTEFSTFLEGFKIKIKRSGNVLTINEVPITSPNLYYNDWLVVHGVRDILQSKTPKETAIFLSQTSIKAVNLKLMTILVAFSSLFLGVLCL